MATKLNPTVAGDVVEIDAAPVWTLTSAFIALISAGVMFSVFLLFYAVHPVATAIVQSLVSSSWLVGMIWCMRAYNALLAKISPLQAEARLYEQRWREAESAFHHMRRSRDEWRKPIIETYGAPKDAKTPAHVIGALEGKVRALESANRQLAATYVTSTAPADVGGDPR